MILNKSFFVRDVATRVFVQPDFYTQQKAHIFVYTRTQHLPKSKATKLVCFLSLSYYAVAIQRPGLGFVPQLSSENIRKAIL